MDNSEKSSPQRGDNTGRLIELETENAELKKKLARHDEHLAARGCTHLALEFCQGVIACVAIVLGGGLVWFVVDLMLRPEWWDIQSIYFLIALVLFGLVPTGLLLALIALAAHLVRKHYRISK